MILHWGGGGCESASSSSDSRPGITFLFLDTGMGGGRRSFRTASRFLVSASMTEALWDLQQSSTADLILPWKIVMFCLVVSLTVLIFFQAFSASSLKSSSDSSLAFFLNFSTLAISDLSLLCKSLN